MKRFITVLLATSCFAFSGRTASATAIFNFNINGTAFDAAMLNCGAVGVQTICSGANLPGTGFELNSWQFVLDPDPTISGSFALTNLSGITQSFSVSATMAVAPVVGPLSISGSVGAGVLTDLNGGGATLSSAVSPLFNALIDGGSVDSLLAAPYSYSVIPGVGGAPGVPVTIPLFSFGPQGLNQSISGSVGVAFPGFTLTAGDQYQTPFAFDATPTSQPPVPEPASMLLLGSGLAAFAVRRRRP